MAGAATTARPRAPARPSLLVSCGEASGDRLLATILARWRGPVFGIGGRASRGAGIEEVAEVPGFGTMGLTDVAFGLAGMIPVFHGLLRAARQRRPRAALLVGFTAFHQRLAPRLRALGVPVLWCAAPQVWAWHGARLRTMRRCMDRLAVLLPHEQPLWRAHGYDAHYVGHPALESTAWGIVDPRQQPSPAVAVLCGSREAEARRLGPVLLETAQRWTRRHPRWRADVLLAASLGSESHARLRRDARQRDLHVRVMSPALGAAPELHRYALAFCASGTACLEAALSGTPPIVAYRFDRLTAFAARHVVTSPWMALPNVVLHHDAFPELFQHHVTPHRLLSCAERICECPQPSWDACRQLRACMTIHDGGDVGGRVRSLLTPWLP